MTMRKTVLRNQEELKNMKNMAQEQENIPVVKLKETSKCSRVLFKKELPEGFVTVIEDD